MAHTTPDDAIQTTLAKIAREVFHLATLAATGDDRRDFREVAVWQIERALRAAYDAGRNDAAAR